MRVDSWPCVVWGMVHAGISCHHEHVTGSHVMDQLADLIDGRRWDDLSALLHRDFCRRYVHTGETFDRDSWVRLTAKYPGFQHFALEDCVSDEPSRRTSSRHRREQWARAALRGSHVHHLA